MSKSPQKTTHDAEKSNNNSETSSNPSKPLQRFVSRVTKLNDQAAKNKKLNLKALVCVNVQPDDSNSMNFSKNDPEVASPAGTTQDDGWMQDQEYDSAEPVLLLQPETCFIFHDQLVVEVKGIYVGLILVETKCIDVDDKQFKAAQKKDSSRQTI